MTPPPRPAVGKSLFPNFLILAGLAIGFSLYAVHYSQNQLLQDLSTGTTGRAIPGFGSSFSGSIANDHQNIMTSWILSAVSAGIFIILLVAHQSWLTKRNREVQAQLPNWNKAMARWNQYYYCARCDGIFYPGHARLFATLNEALYGIPG